MKNLILILCFIFPYFLNAQNTFVVKGVTGGNIHEIYQLNLTPDTSLIFQFEFEPSSACYDIALSPSGKFYGVGNSQLYEINENDGTTTFLHAVPFNSINTALVCSNDNILYVLNSNGYIYKYDITNDLFEEVVQIQGGSPGDITFYKGNLIFQSRWDGNIKAFNLADQSLVTIHCLAHPLNDSGQVFFGLSNNSDDCESLSIIGASTANDFYEIDIANDTIKHINPNNPFLDLKSLFLGTASTNEHFSSTCSFQFSNVDCAQKDTSFFFILGKTPTDNLYHIYSLNPDQTLTFKYEFYSEFGCSDIASVFTGLLYGLGTDSPPTLFKINPISGKVQELVKYPANKIIEAIVSDYETSIFAIDQDGLVHVYDIFCNNLNTFIDPMGHAPTSDLAYQNENIIFQSKVDGNIKAYNTAEIGLSNILCVAPPYNNTSTGGFVGMSNYFLDCDVNKYTAFNNQNMMFELNLDSDSITQIPLNLSGLGDNVMIQGTAYNKPCSEDINIVYSNVLCTSAVEEIGENIDINIFPNPVKDILTITADVTIQQIKIYDMNGRIWRDINLTSKNINLEELSQGVYMLEIQTDAGSFSRKIIKE